MGSSRHNYRIDHFGSLLFLFGGNGLFSPVGNIRAQIGKDEKSGVMMPLFC